MLVQLYRTSILYDHEAPDPRAYRGTTFRTSYVNGTFEEIRASYKVASWFFAEGTTNHRELPTGDSAVDLPEVIWLMEIPSLEWAVEEWGDIMVQKVKKVPGVSFYVEILDDDLE